MGLDLLSEGAKDVDQSKIFCASRRLESTTLPTLQNGRRTGVESLALGSRSVRLRRQWRIGNFGCANTLKPC